MNIKGIIAIAVVAGVVFAAGLYVPKVLEKWDIKVDVSAQKKVKQYDLQALAQQVVPSEGVKIPVRLGDIGPKLIESGVIDLEKFKKAFVGDPLADEQLQALTKGSDQELVINAGNAHFYLNFFWAFGLANKNKILEEGQMMQGGKKDVGNFASTGGWTIAKKNAVEYYSKFEIAPLNPDQQKIVEEVAGGVYRPCCNNPTSFPDCNHGMAALGLAELMAVQGATADQIFDALKAFNSYWFSNQYIELARYFEVKDGKTWRNVPARIILSKDYSSSSGAKKVHDWLSTGGFLPKVQSQGPGCGV